MRGHNPRSMFTDGGLSTVALVSLLVTILPIFFAIGEAMQTTLSWPEVRDASATVCITNLMAVGVVALTFPVALVFAVFLGRLRVAGAWIAGSLLAVVTALPLVAQIAGWQAWMGPGGVLPAPLSALRGMSYLQSVCLVIVFHSLVALPFATLVAAWILRQVDDGMEEASLTQAGTFQTLMRITIPASLGPLQLLFISIATPILTEITIVDLLGFSTTPEAIFQTIELGGSGASYIVASIPFVLLGSWWMMRSIPALDFSESSRHTTVARLPASDRSVAFSTGSFWVFTVLMTLPIIGIIWQLGLVNDDTGMTSWQSAAALAFVRHEWLVLRQMIAENIVMATISGWSIWLLSALWAWWWFFGNRVVRVMVGWIIGLMVFMPAPLVGLGFIGFMNRPGLPGIFYDSSFIVHAGHVLRVAPITFAILLIAFSRLDLATYESAQLHGASSWILWRVALRDQFPATGTAFLVAIIGSINELTVTKLIAPPGTEPLVMHLFSVLHQGTANQQAAVAFFYITAASLMTMVVVMFLGRPHNRNRFPKAEPQRPETTVPSRTQRSSSRYSPPSD